MTFTLADLERRSNRSNRISAARTLIEQETGLLRGLLARIRRYPKAHDVRKLHAKANELREEIDKRKKNLSILLDNED